MFNIYHQLVKKLKGRAVDNYSNEPFVTWLSNVAATDNPPLIFSVSYGEDEKSSSVNYANRCNYEFQKAGLLRNFFLKTVNEIFFWLG